MTSNQAPVAFDSLSTSPAKMVYFPPNHKVRKASIAAVPESQRSVSLSGTETYSTKKEYCDFWMRTGECNFADFTKSEEGVGCIYKHEMPTDRVQLRKLGFPHGVPKWYKEKVAIATAGDLNWSQQRIAQDNVGGRMSKEPSVSRDFHRPPTNSQKDTYDVLHDLIDLSDSPISTSESCPPVSVSSSSSVVSCHANVANVWPSKLLSRTMASRLRSEHETKNFDERDTQAVSESQLIDRPFFSSELRAEQGTRHIERNTAGSKSQALPFNKLPGTSEGQTHLTASLARMFPQTKVPGFKLRDEPQKNNGVLSEPEITTQPFSKSFVGSNNDGQTKPSKSHPARKSRPQKLNKHTTTFGPQGGLASSKHAADNQTKGFDKYRSAQSNNMDL